MSAEIVEMKKPAKAHDTPASDKDVILAAVENVLHVQEHLERGLQLATQVIGELQMHVRDLEAKVAALQKNAGKKPAIYNSQGGRAN